MVKVYVNDKPVEVGEGAHLLDAIIKAGYSVPTLCFFKEIYREASCRMCIVELANGRLVPACAYPVSEGLKIYTDTERVRRNRRVILELILAAHRMKCQSCPRKGGYCLLLDLAKEYGVEGIPVCAECPLHESECLLTKGIPCLGPITMAGCNSPCTREGTPCIGCRGPITRKDVLEEAAKLYLKYNIDLDELYSKMKLFWNNHPKLDYIYNVIKEVIKENTKEGSLR